MGKHREPAKRKDGFRHETPSLFPSQLSGNKTGKPNPGLPVFITCRRSRGTSEIICLPPNARKQEVHYC